MPDLNSFFPNASKLAAQFPRPQLPEGFGNLPSAFGSQGYSLSYQGGDKDRLMGKDAYTSASFPDFMRQGAPTGGLQHLNQNLGQYFDFNPIQQSADALQQMQMSAAKGAANSASRAMVNRSIQAGGTGAGADFARASALQPFFRQQAQQNLDLNQLRAQMMQSQGQMSGQLLSGIAGLKQQNRTNRQNYAVDAARLAQKNIGIGGSVGYGRGNGLYDDQLLKAQIGQMTPDRITPGYIPNSGGITPGTVNGQVVNNRAFTGDLATQRFY